MKRYAVIYEKGEKNWSAFVPDVPGCVAAGKTQDETRDLMAGALRFHLRSMKEDREPIPEPACLVGYVEVDIGEETVDPIEDLIRRRIAGGLTQAQVAGRMGIARERVTELEKDPGSVRYSRVLRYAAAVDAALKAVDVQPKDEQNRERQAS